MLASHGSRSSAVVILQRREARAHALISEPAGTLMRERSRVGRAGARAADAHFRRAACAHLVRDGCRLIASLSSGHPGNRTVSLSACRCAVQLCRIWRWPRPVTPALVLLAAAVTDSLPLTLMASAVACLVSKQPGITDSEGPQQQPSRRCDPVVERRKPGGAIPASPGLTQGPVVVRRGLPPRPVHGELRS